MGFRSFAAAVVLLSLTALTRAQLPVDAAGWTLFTPSPDTRFVYVSSIGDDANSGLSDFSPKRTLAAGFALLRDGYPDWLLLRSSDVFYERFPQWTKSGRSASEPMRIGVYGGLPRATIYCGASTGLWGAVGGMTPKGHLAITDLTFVAHTYNGSNSLESGVRLLGSWTDVLFENVAIRGFCTNLVVQADRRVEFMHDIRVRRCLIADAYHVGADHAEGCYFAGVDKLLIEESVFDHNGWHESVAGAVPTIFRHNIYIQGHEGAYDDCTNVTTRGLISARAAATGMQQRPGGLCDNSLFISNPLNLVFGTTGGTVQDCVVIGSRDIDPANLRGVGYNLVNGGNMRAKRCISVGQPSEMGTQNVIGFSVDGATNVVLENCVAWKWKSVAGQGAAVEAFNAPMPSITGSNLEQSPPLYTVSVEAYMTTLGKPPSIAAFMSECRQQSRANWRAQYTAAGFNTWARAAFGMASQPCYANCDGSAAVPVLNVSDFTCFLGLVSTGDPRANCDGSAAAPVLNLADFTCFLTKFAAGCP